jgi:hypothetical protein
MVELKAKLNRPARGFSKGLSPPLLEQGRQRRTVRGTLLEVSGLRLAVSSARSQQLEAFQLGYPFGCTIQTHRAPKLRLPV